MENRLVPINGFLCLLQPNDVTPPVLADAGFHLAGLEVSAEAHDGSVVIDGLIFHPEASHLVAAEAKCGSNIEPAQARKYGQIDPVQLVQTAYVSLRSTEAPTAEVVYVCRGENLVRIRKGLTKEALAYSIIAVGPTMIDLDPGANASPHLSKAFAGGPVAMAGPPARLIPFDHESPDSQVRPVVLAALVEAMAQRCSELTLKGLAERATPHLAMYSRRTQGDIVKKVARVARAIAEDDPTHFQFVPQNGKRDGIVRILKSPGALHVRGRTQAWRAVGRPGRVRRGTQRVEVEGQLDLLGDLYAVENDADEQAEEVLE